MDQKMQIRPMHDHELDALAGLWFEGWRDAHAALVPEELVRRRTLETFRARIEAGRDTVRLAVAEGAPTAPLGFTMLKGDEMNQLFVAREARGAGIAAQLLAEAEARLLASGVTTAWLACLIGNDRAARFYEKQGWRRVGTFVSQLETPEGVFPLEVWRYEKRLAAG